MVFSPFPREIQTIKDYSHSLKITVQTADKQDNMKFSIIYLLQHDGHKQDAKGAHY